MSKSRDRKAGGEALDAAAGNGLLDRRALLGRGMALAGAIALVARNSKTDGTRRARRLEPKLPIGTPARTTR